MTNEMFRNPQALTKQLVAAANNLSDQEATQRYKQILAQLPPDQATDLNALALSQVSAGQRHTLAAQFKQAHQNPNSPFDGYVYDDDDAATPIRLGQMSVRAQQQDPQLLGGLLGGNNPVGGQIGKAALAALAALLIRRMMNSQSSGAAQGQSAGANDAVGAIINILLGGGANAGLGGMSGQTLPSGGIGNQPSQSFPGGGDLGGLLGGLLGGNAPASANSSGAGGLGGLLGGLLGGNAPASANSSGAGGLGDLLGSILGGNTSPDDRGSTESDQLAQRSHRK